MKVIDFEKDLENETLVVKSAINNVGGKIPGSQVKIQIDDIENERCTGNKAAGLPMNSDFQDECIKTKNSSTGAYLRECLGGPTQAKNEAKNETKTKSESETVTDSQYNSILKLFENVSKTIGSTKPVINFMNKGDNIIFTAVTEKDDHGKIITSPVNISFAVQEMVKTAKTNGFSEILCPVFGSGHGGVRLITAIKAMIAGAFAAFEVFGCRGMTVTIKVHKNSAINSIDDIKRMILNDSNV